MNRYEYKEPEFKVVKVNSQDVITTSGDSLPGASSGWEAGGSGSGSGGVPIISL